LDWFIDGWLLSPRRLTFIAQIDKMDGITKIARDMFYWFCGVVRMDRNSKESKKEALAKAIKW